MEKSVTQAAITAMQIEGSRSNPGFNGLLSVAASIAPDPAGENFSGAGLLTTASTPALSQLGQPPFNPAYAANPPRTAPAQQTASAFTQQQHQLQTAATTNHFTNVQHAQPPFQNALPPTQHTQPLLQPAPPPLQPHYAQPAQQLPLVPNPATWSHQQEAYSLPTASEPLNYMSAADLVTIRLCLPNIKDMSDQFLSNTPMDLLLKINAAAQPTPAQTQDMQAVVFAAAAAAAQFSAFNPSVQDPGTRMAKNLEKLRENPTFVPEGRDDRISLLHDARFLAGAVASGVDLWRMAREVIGLEGLVPLANYDMECMGLGGSITTKGTLEAHNPGSMNLVIKLFSPENMCTTSGAARRFTLADDDGAVSVGEHMREISEMNTLQHAMRALVGLTRLIMPWNLSFCAIDGFLYSSTYGLAELGNDPLRVPKLVKFVNYVLGRNAAAWQRKEPFLTCGALKQEFGSYLQCQAFGAFIPATVSPANTYQQNANKGNRGRGRGGRFTRPFYGNGGFKPNNNQNGTNRGGGNGGGYQNGGGNQHGGGRGGFNHGNSNNTPPTGYHTPNGYVTICRNYNYGTCKNPHNNCVLPSGTRAQHVCNARNNNGDLCKDQHPACDHK